MKDEDYDELWLKTFLEMSSLDPTSLSLEQIDELRQVNQDLIQLREDSQEKLYAALIAKGGTKEEVEEKRAQTAVNQARLEARMKALRSKIGMGSNTPS